jgi:hypothetical protein
LAPWRNVSTALSRPLAFGVSGTAKESLPSLSIVSLNQLGPTSGAFRQVRFLSGYIFLNMLNMRTFCFPVRFQRAVLQYLGKVANLIIGEANDPP